ncbi:hypothetical protein [Staphylococcus simulans]|uniref:hypothetical protein n=1 Tax=Staphylococcus simulans TaxID=1286 RepID=UPI0021D0F0F8|nr:hypothetical protein [Staphylococcus simulans]UXV42631.1 hypothetical protein MUA12_01390 [Staphylococcus simulans]
MSDVQLVPYDSKYDQDLEKFTIAEAESAFALLPFAALEDLAPGEYLSLFYINNIQLAL